MSSNKPYMQPYHRPNQTWTCGRDGQECLCGTGPTGEGTCRDPKNPCRPQWTLRTRRRVFVVACFAIALSYVLIGLWQPIRDRFALPGPLNSVHARLVSHDVNLDPHTDSLGASQTCAHCHDAGGKAPIQWLASVFDCGRSPDGAGSQSQKCLKCHEAQLGSKWAMFAHNVDPVELAMRTNAPAAASVASERKSPLSGMLALVSAGTTGSATVTADSAKQLSCATCHHEHKGANVDIKAMTDRQCQSCHKSECRSFATDHPQFTKWPSYSEQPHIAFTHVAHEAKHFPSKNQTFDCNRCHVDDGDRNTKLLAGFQQACASCHEGEIKVAAAEGMAVVALPTFDFEAFRREKARVPDNWPKAAQGDFDGKLPDIMVLLLAADKKAAGALARFAPHFDMAKVDGNTPDDVKSAAVLAVAIADLLKELQADARVAVRQRIESLRGRPILEAELDRLMSRLPQELLSQTVERWFPAQGQKSSPVADATRPSSWHFVLQPKPAVQSVWLRANPLKGMVRKPVESKGNATAAKEAAPTGQNAAKSQATTPKAIAVPANASGELLRANPLAKPAGEKQPSAPLPEASADPEPAVVGPEPTSSSEVAEARPTDKSPEESVHHSAQFAVTGGWFADDETFAIKYRPEGHADPVMVAWLEIASDLANRQDAWATSVKKLVRGSAAQTCIRCHAGAAPETGIQSMRWHAEMRDTSVRPFTKFSHRPHVLSNDQQACRTCHELNHDLLTTVNQENLGDRALTGTTILAPPARCDFKPLEKAACAQCHNATGASQSCTQCHNYHVGAKVGGSW